MCGFLIVLFRDANFRQGGALAIPTESVRTIVAFVQQGYEKAFTDTVEHLREFVHSRGWHLELRHLEFLTPSDAALPAKRLADHEYPVVLVGNGFGAIGAIVLLSVAEAGLIVHSLIHPSIEPLRTVTSISDLIEQNLVQFFHLEELAQATGFLAQTAPVLA